MMDARGMAIWACSDINDPRAVTIAKVEQAVKEAIAAERSECAKIAENLGLGPGGIMELPRKVVDVPRVVSERIAAAIRARGQT